VQAAEDRGRNAGQTTLTKVHQEHQRQINDLRRKAQDDAAKATANAKKQVADKTKELDTTRVNLAAADKKVKDAEAALGPVIAKLKAAKLIDPAADNAAAVAALPDAVKKAFLATGTDTATAELTAAVDAARKARDEAEGKTKAAEAALTTAKADAAKKIGELEEAMKGFDAKLAAEHAKADAARAADAKKFEEQLAAQAERFRQQLTVARSGAFVPLTDSERAAQDRARKFYAAGLEAYTAGLFANAEGWFDRAAKDDPADARYWYYLGLSKWSQGKAKDAEADFRTGADWEGRSKPGRRVVGDALVKVQGPPRAALDVFRP
jgi:colicin import membrane protein